MLELGHYGLHWLPGEIAVLMQGSGPETAFGLEIEAVRIGKGRCNHRINLSAVADLPDLSDPLIQAMLPLPRQGAIPWIDKGDKQALATLARMSSPIQPTVRPLWSMTQHMLLNELAATNVQPLVLTDIEPQHRHLVERVIALAATAPRPVLLEGSPRMPQRPGFERITTSVEIDPSLPWEAIGATVLRRTMLGQAITPN
jgi:hypothetical protein